MKKLLFTTLCIISLYGLSFSQTITQTVKGKIFDKTTQESLIGATIILINSDPMVGTSTNLDGEYILENVPVGRQSIKISMVGYESYYANELLISSGKQIILEVGLQEEVTELGAVVIRPEVIKDKPLNEMAAVSSRQFTVEETQRYAGGLNDPARLVSSFAGVATPSISSNGISVRGNSPSGLLWRVEEVEVPSPNHFADLTIAGAGLLTVLSSQMMGNSDFTTGAFPAEYGNATSGVFDINLRTGNSSKREYTLQAGVLGVDFATEGPFKKEKEASYLLNYRYSTMALISPLLPSNSGVLKYQDLSYKINLPTPKAGKFSIWSLAAYDGIDLDALDSTEWESKNDKENSQTAVYMFATGINHKIRIKPNAFLKTAVAVTGNGLTFEQQRLDDNIQPQPQSSALKNFYKYTLQSSLTHYWGDKHINRTGFYFNHLEYNIAIKETSTLGTLPETLIDEKGKSDLIQFYSQSTLNLAPQLILNAGVHSQYFKLNNEFSFEPRIALNYHLNDKSSFALAYGLHSKIESLPLYFVKDGLGNQLNKNLSLMKSNHFVASFNTMLTENLKISIEPYYQYLSNVPVALDGYITTLNTQNNLFFNTQLVSEGTGVNMGIDFTIERYLSGGLYYLLSASIFDSKYTANDGVERNTRLNKNYVFNALVGKEWQMGKHNNNIFSANFRLNYLGGNRIESIDQINSLNQEDIIYGETNGNLSFAEKHPDTPILSFTLSYRKNKPKYSSVWALQVLNASSAKEFDTDYFSLKTKTVEQKYSQIMVPNLSYKIEF